jgi:hypothetical protein
MRSRSRGFAGAVSVFGICVNYCCCGGGQKEYQVVVVVLKFWFRNENEHLKWRR